MGNPTHQRSAPWEGPAYLDRPDAAAAHRAGRGSPPRDARAEILCILCGEPTPYQKIMSQGLAGVLTALVSAKEDKIAIVCNKCKGRIEQELEAHTGGITITITKGDRE